MSNQWIYIKTEPALWSIGHYNPNGEFIAESDWTTPDKAAARVNYLNGGTGNIPGNILDPKIYETR